ncbi:tryparedoxin peroxidase [Epithele typhae]|uniref:tryparedoxin peroxidase n=1 Tax=Epithele typhae TaxID=378194 RepID=UPI002008842D|nr:tryparedoxin peroxidase [Epithele typhae]KAH9905565.1 tryparedoxin peroxidase [Epithele typhae]
MSVSHHYCVLIEDEGIALCGLLIIDPIGYPQLDKQITINDLPVGRSVEGTIRAFQFSRIYFHVIGPVSKSTGWQ